MQKRRLNDYKILILIVSCFPFISFAQDDYVSHEMVENGFTLANDATLPSLYIDAADFEGVKYVVEDLSQDIERVTGKLPKIDSSGSVQANSAIIIGTLGKSALIDKLVNSGKIDPKKLEGKWETFQIETVNDPMPGVSKALVIVGSDKRGTIFGMYDLSSNIGVSPWYWWADVPAKKAKSLYIKPGVYTDGSPKIKYRGIFINDEAPALSGWVGENFGDFNSEFYEHVFELILRNKGNFLWPAMWGRAFYDDDPKNPELADAYGVVIGTSHHEPLSRAHDEWRRYGEGEWDYTKNPENLQKFWRDGMKRMGDNESLVTIGMRGDGDEPMSEGTAISLLENIVSDQREIIADVTGKPTEETPQVWALYKEVQDYYDQGMRVPDDVTLLLADDNWGNIRKLPNPDEEPRKGGYGIYYHYDYVGGPRNYKWINTNQISRVWEQMDLAYKFGATRLWIVNVGDIKPMEFPISFFLDYAWDPEAIAANDLKSYTVNWAKDNFPEEFAEETADLLLTYSKYNSRRKPELLSPETYNITTGEADHILEEFTTLEKKADEVYEQLPEEYKDAFYQLVLFPVKASANINRLYISAAKNKLYAAQGRVSANHYAQKVEDYFQKDKELTNYYHKELANGKWNHMMAQTHIGYTYWQEPKENKAPETTNLKIPERAKMGIAIQNSNKSWTEASEEIILPAFDPFNNQERFIDIFNKGSQPFTFEITTKHDWLDISSEKGMLKNEKRIVISLNWEKIPEDVTEASFTVKGADEELSITAPILRPKDTSTVNGYVEDHNVVSIPATGYSKKSDGEFAWFEVPNLGKTGSAMVSNNMPAGKAFDDANPSMEYKIYTFNSGNGTIEFKVSPTLDFLDQGGLRFAYSVNNSSPKIVNIQKDTKDNWNTSVANNVTSIEMPVSLENSGNQTLKVWAIDPGISLQKIIVKTGEVPYSYLGAEDSSRAK